MGLEIPPGPRFGVDGTLERFIRVPYTLPDDQLAEAIELLARAWRSVTGSTAAGALRAVRGVSRRQSGISTRRTMPSTASAASISPAGDAEDEQHGVQVRMAHRGVGDLAQRRLGVERHPEPGRGEHVDVVGAVTDGHGLLHRHAGLLRRSRAAPWPFPAGR